jgi:hypothetical protein
MRQAQPEELRLLNPALRFLSSPDFMRLCGQQ